ncbi:MAG: F0F1 ATP synthase subunit epsilon [Candidatus Vogelbacteria bacterium]|nr:F0F1 ATP synthase subunit epsilon [Candidatus Vogelbacteria bacterium]
MLLTILSLNKVEYRCEVSGFNVKTYDGDITILNGHHPLVTSLEKCTAQIISTDNKRTPFEIKSGFLEMSEGNKLNVMID